MFDRAIIDTDRFMDMPLGTKAAYFLLGMEADDEGFVSHKKVMRIHGISEDDIKLMSLKGFVIIFPSGVSVITDWNKNNWLDSRRSKPTEYQVEKKQLSLTDTREYVLSKSLASIEESRVEERSIEEEIDENQQPLFEIVSFGYIDEKGVPHETQISEYEDWLNKESWEEWVSFRKELKKRLTPTAISSQWKFLKQYSKEDQALIIETSIRNSYQGLFPPKGASNQKTIHAAR